MSKPNSPSKSNSPEAREDAPVDPEVPEGEMLDVTDGDGALEADTIEADVRSLLEEMASSFKSFSETVFAKSE